MMEPLSINKYALTVAETASVLGVSSCKVYQLIRDGLLAAQKFGRTWRIPVDVVRNFAGQIASSNSNGYF